MASTVRQLIEKADSSYGGAVRWGDRVPDAGRIYLISVTGSPDELGEIGSAPIDSGQVDILLHTASALRVDGEEPTTEGLTARLASMWVAGEPVLYIGKATSLSSRVGQYYSTRLGARSPHAGGWPLKVLSNLGDLWVHWATSPMPELAEQMALATFVRNVSEASRAAIVDPDHPYPYANLDGPGGRKRHGIQGATSAGKPIPPKPRVESVQRPASQPPPADGSRTVPTQRVTSSDLRAGRIRIPRSSKSIFPPERTNIPVRLRGASLMSRWDPRLGPPERSGVIGIGKQSLMSAVTEDEVLFDGRSGDEFVIQ